MRTNDPALDGLLSQARTARVANDIRTALGLLHRALARFPEEPRILNTLGSIKLEERDYRTAANMFERAAAVDPAPPILLNLSFAYAGLGDVVAERAALDRALTADPYYQLALFHRGNWLLGHGTRAAAAREFANFLATFPTNATIPPPLRRQVAKAQSVVAEDAAVFAKSVRQALGGADSSVRITECVDVMVGDKRIYHAEPTGLYVPFLPEVPFFDRALFPWFADLEAATSAITAELLEVLAADAGLEPYIAFGADKPVNQWAALNHSRDWSTFKLWRDGTAAADKLDRCPVTAEILSRLPLLDLPGRGPNAMFSILQPGAHIPPHVGSTNARSVVHLPLVVPPDCAFRVGATTRTWVVGEAWAFDDTIEHEAWNHSDSVRAILIVDVWNPYLNDHERADLAKLTAALEAHAGRMDWSV